MCSRAIILILCIISVFKLVDCDVYRLPKNVKPIRYILTIQPLMNENLYNGSVAIEIKTLENTNSITLHKKGMHIAESDIKIVNSSGADILISNTTEHSETETYTIFLENELLKNSSYNLTIAYFAREYADERGFLRVHTRERDGESETIVALTQFEPTGARAAFPCFDEPSLKAKFVISLIRREGYHSISNEALKITETLEAGLYKDTFKETPIMSTYAVAFIVSDCKCSEKIGKQRFCGLSNVVENGELDKAAEVGIKALQALEDYTGINYTLSKIDHFTGRNFPISGMENWGLITYAESYVRITNYSNAVKLQLMNMIVAHELAHQWFGNLVTFEWWDYLWLSEAFANYFQYYILSIVKPSWRTMDQIVVDSVQRALYTEEFTEAGRLNDPIKRSGDIPLQHIMYMKGSSILRMTEHFLTHKVFRRGLQMYLQNKKFSTARPADLYSALQKAVDDAGVNNLLGNMSVSDILTTWDSTKGFPIVNVTRNYTSGCITLTQWSSACPHPRIIPINYVWSSANGTDFSNTTANYWLTEKNAIIDNNFPTDGWVIVNIQQNGYYRVNYDVENWERLIKFMNSDNFTSIHVLNRAQLMHDAFNLAYNKMIPWHIPLRLCEYLIRERDYIPIATFSNLMFDYVFTYNRRSFEDEYEYFENHTVLNTISENISIRDLYKEYIDNTFRRMGEYLGPTPKSDESHLDQLSRLHLKRLKQFHIGY